MKAVVQAAWLMTTAIGRFDGTCMRVFEETQIVHDMNSLITILVSESSILPTVWGTLYLFAGLMILVTFVHVYLAKRYMFVEDVLAISSQVHFV